MNSMPGGRRVPGPKGAAAVGSVAGLTLISRALGFLRWVVQATTVGAGTVAGAYATANQVPNVLYEVVVGGALASTVVPLLASAAYGATPERSARVASGLLGVVMLVLVPAAAILALAAGPIAELLPVSVDADAVLQRELVTSFLRMFALQVPLYGLGVVLTGVLQAHHSFTWPALAPVLSSLVVMATYGLYGQLRDSSPQTALLLLGWGTTAGVAALSLPLLIPIRQLGIRLRPALGLAREDRRRALSLAGAGAWTLLAQQASVLVVLALARSGGTSGTVAVYQYTQAVYLLPYAVLAVPVATVLYPRLSAAFSGAGPDAGKAQALAARGTALVTAVACAGAAALVAASAGAERFFNQLTEVDGMGWALVALAPAVLGFSLLHQLTRVLFAAHRSRQAALAASLGWLVVIGASALAVRLLAPGGGAGSATLLALSLGLSAGMLVAAGALIWLLALYVGAATLKPIWRCLGVCLPVAALGGYLARLLTLALSGAWLMILMALLLAIAVAGLVLAAGHLAQPGLFAILGRGSRTAADEERREKEPAL
ncbi:integral membrane protein MviN [Actinomyces bovis]|uniref:Integral membrane protein MviN n=1 Tax=Actinomyces bovis TaxID=1658 RepID=A0ABY1VPW3_9ACTO|nr:lipid II flippase MurJ [Actinomyces bovis]SPT54168.1 integral membrane protein MviN [Actinomyces bovis]VEG53559.1 integral membrane protein MviN [Actinomyces israelii]